MPSEQYVNNGLEMLAGKTARSADAILRTGLLGNSSILADAARNRRDMGTQTSFRAAAPPLPRITHNNYYHHRGYDPLFSPLYAPRYAPFIVSRPGFMFADRPSLYQPRTAKPRAKPRKRVSRKKKVSMKKKPAKKT